MFDGCYRWRYDPHEPKSKWGDLDRIAHWVEEQGYKPKTSIENLVIMLASHFLGDCVDRGKDWPCSDVLIDDIALFVEQSGTLREFDYYC